MKILMIIGSLRKESFNRQLGAECWQSNQLVLTDADIEQLRKQAEAFVAFIK
ncbi:MAG: hypothetical protein HUJ75_06900 [Parasporobacterium sp.]|nr:hypothetical protein [Parasporobacterium sp.]